MPPIAPVYIQAAGSNPGDIQAGSDLVIPKPPFIPANGCAKVQVQVLYGTEIGEFLIYLYQSTGNWTLAQLTTLAPIVVSAWTAELASIYNTSCALYQVTCSDMSSRTGPRYEHPVEPNIAGTRAGTDSTATINIGIGTHTGYKGRSNNGRVTIGGNITTDFALGVPVDSARVSYIGAYGNFLSTFTGLGYTVVLISLRSGNLWRTTAQVSTLAFITVGEFIYTMRRRLPGHNRHR